jgi:predicted nuclease with TOPRIM domain
LPSKEITELQQTSSKLQYTTLQLTKKLDDIKEKSIQSELEIKQLLQEKEKHHSEMLSMKSTIQQMQEDMKLLLKKTSELHYENTVLTKMVEDEKIKTKQLSDSLKESYGLSFTQANTIGQALMKDSDVFNCM